jgi:hypothetical protein
MARDKQQQQQQHHHDVHPIDPKQTMLSTAETLSLCLTLEVSTLHAVFSRLQLVVRRAMHTFFT